MEIRVTRTDEDPMHFVVSWGATLNADTTNLEQFKLQARAVAEALYADLIDQWCIERSL